MDHNSFDKKLKGKLEGLTPSPHATHWDEMESILDYSLIKPWYMRWSKPLWSAGIVTLTLLNFYFFYQNRQNRNDIEGMLSNSEAHVKVDTIYIQDTVFLNNNSAEAYAQSGNNQSNYFNSGNSANRSTTMSNNQTLSNRRNALPATSIYYQNSGAVFGTPLSNSFAKGTSSLVYSNDLLKMPQLERVFDFVDPITEEVIVPENWLATYAEQYPVDQVKITDQPAKRMIRKRFPNEFRLGLQGGVLVPEPDIGEKYVNKRFGVMVEKTVGRNLAVLSGLYYHGFNYKLNGVDDKNFADDDLIRFPGFSELESFPDDIVINNELLHIPLHLRLYRPLTYNWSVFLSGGFSLDLLYHQSFIYTNLDIENDQLVVNNVHTEIDKLNVYLGTMSGSVGIEHRFSRSLAGQVNLDYQYGLNKIGVEQRSVNSMSLNIGVLYKVK